MKWPNKNRSSRFVQLQNRHFNWRFAILIFFFINWNSCKPSFHIAVYLRFLNKSAISTSGPVICKKKIFPNLSYVDGIVGNIFPINAKWELVCFWAILWKKTQHINYTRCQYHHIQYMPLMETMIRVWKDKRQHTIPLSKEIKMLRLVRPSVRETHKLYKIYCSLKFSLLFINIIFIINEWNNYMFF